MGDQIEFEPAAVCQECGKANSIRRTVPWQPDLCTNCGADIVVREEQ